MEIQYFRHPDAPAGVPPLAVRAGDFVFFAGGIAADPVFHLAMGLLGWR